MNSNVILITILVLIVATNFIFVLLKKHIPKNDSINAEEYIAQKEHINKFCKLINIANIITLIGGLVGVYFDSMLIYLLFLSIPIPFVVLYANSKRIRSNYSNKKSGNAQIKKIAVLCIVLFSLCWVYYQWNGNLDISINKTELKIEGLYGTNISYSNIKTINMQGRLPNIKLRSNGFALGNTKLGHFITQDEVHIMLFTYSDSCFIRIITKNGETYYLNCKQSDETIRIFNEIKKHL